jgi:hypothetical protein
MTANEAAIRKAYQVAENQDVAGFVNCFTEDGTFTDESIGHTYRGPEELGRTVEIYAKAFPDMPSYDYVVVGAGTAGCVLAGELSASGAHVRLIESGGTDEAPTVLNPRRVVLSRSGLCVRSRGAARPEHRGLRGVGRLREPGVEFGFDRPSALAEI